MADQMEVIGWQFRYVFPDQNNRRAGWSGVLDGPRKMQNGHKPYNSESHGGYWFEVRDVFGGPVGGGAQWCEGVGWEQAMSALFSQEHYALMAQFEQQFKGERFDREDKSYWPKGHIYQDGHVNNMFLAFRRGVAYGTAVERSNAGVAVVSVPHGWKLVPLEPTEEMLSAVRKKPHPTRPDGWDAENAKTYQRMLSHAPNPAGVAATSTDQEWKDFQAWQEELRRRPDGVAVPAKLVTHCPWCAAPVSVADEPYCANADCRWNNGGTLPELLSMTVADVLRIVDANPTRQDIERALIANLPSNGGPRAPGVPGTFSDQGEKA